jgi:Tfp pilus assembly protein PilO
MSARDRTIIGLVAVVALAVAGWLFVVQPKRDKASSLATQANSLQSQIQAVRATVAQSEAARNAFAGSYTVLARLGEAVPADDNVPSLIYQIQNAAAKAHIQFNSLSLGSTAGSSSSSSSSSTPGAAAAAPLPPGATVGSAGFPIEPFQFTFTGNFFHLADFFGRLERFVTVGSKDIAVSGRLLTLDSINLTVGQTGFPNITATMSATTYLLPASEGLTAGATPLGPGTTTTSASSAAVTPAAVVAPPTP